MTRGARVRPMRLDHPRKFSVEEYLRLEGSSNVKHEYLDGQILAMGGGTLEHASLAMRIATSATMRRDLFISSAKGGTTRIDPRAACWTQSPTSC